MQFFYEYQQLIGIITVLIGIYSYVPYIRDILAGVTKPHAFTRFIRSLLTSIAFFAQVTDNGGAGTWAMSLTAIGCFVIFLLGIKYGKHTIAQIDYVFFGISLISLYLRYLTETPLRSMIIITIIDAFAFFPTIRKTRYNPYEETLVTYVISFVKMVLSIFALENLTLITTLYPLSLVIMSGGFMIMMIYRRRVVHM